MSAFLRRGIGIALVGVAAGVLGLTAAGFGQIPAAPDPGQTPAAPVPAPTPVASVPAPAPVAPDAAQTPAAPVAGQAAASDAAAETIVGIRHGEKPHEEIGQLDVRGLNRSLALPKVLLRKFGKPQFIFAPDPAATVPGHDGSAYCYIRPLATIEPTAILCGLPVNTTFGLRDIKALEAELVKPSYQGKMVFVAWEHVLLEKLFRATFTDLGGDGAQIPKWPGADFDSIYILKILPAPAGHATATFTLDHENITGLSDTFPAPGEGASTTPP